MKVDIKKTKENLIRFIRDWFSKNGVFPPAKLDMQKLQKAIDSRK